MTRRVHLINFIRKFTLTSTLFLAPLYFLKLGYTGVEIGAVVSCFAFAPILLSIPTGWTNDRFSIKRVIAAALLAQGALLVVMGQARGVAAMAAVFLFFGLANNALDVSLGQQLAEARDRLVKASALAGVEGFSPTNDNHIRDLLYNKLGLPKLNKTAKGLASVDKNTLKQLEHDVVRLLLDYNKLDKLYTVNVVGLRSLIRGDDGLGYLPFRINPLGARTGRRASSNPNSQNWPESVRGLITSRFGVDGRILNADYSKLEVVLIAWVAGDAKLLSAFTGGKGYIDVAKELFGFDVINGTPQYTAVKSIVLGVHYNMQTPKMARQLALLGVKFSADWEEHERETDRLRTLYLRQYAGIGRYMEEREARWLRTGRSDSYTGRSRHLPVPARGEAGYGHALNQAINFPIQSLASDVTASALMDFEAEMLALAGMNYSQWLSALIEQRRNFLTKGVNCSRILPVSQLFNEVHDSLVVDLFPDTAKRDTDCLIDCMKSVRSLKKLAPGFDNSILNADWKLSTHWKSK